MTQAQYELDLIVATYQQYGHDYVRRRLSGELLFNDYIEQPAVRGLLGSGKRLRGSSALDIGCGPGIYTSLLLNAGAHVLAIDSSQVMLNATRDNCGSINRLGVGSATFVLSSFEEVNLADKKFDIVLATFMLSYFPDLVGAFKKMRAHLAPRGRVITSMLHPIRMFATGKSDQGYVISDYFAGGFYEADFLHENSSIPLHRYNFEDLHKSAVAGKLKITQLLEPHASLDCKFWDKDKVAFYHRHPSILVMELMAK